MKKNPFTLFDSKSREIRGIFFSAPGAKGTVIIVHGILEHKGVMLEMTEILVNNEFNVICFDLPGFGESGGRRCYIESFDELDQAILRVHEYCKKKIGNKPFFVIGNSMGSLLSVYFTAKTSAVAGLILFAPFFDLPFPDRFIFKPLSRIAYAINPLFYLQSLIVPERLTSDRMVIYKYAQDPLKGKLISSGFSHAMFRRIPVKKKLPVMPNLPVIIFNSAKDKIVNPFAVSRFLKMLPHPDKTLYSYADCGHDLLHDKNRNAIFNSLINWLDKHS